MECRIMTGQGPSDRGGPWDGAGGGVAKRSARMFRELDKAGCRVGADAGAAEAAIVAVKP